MGKHRCMFCKFWDRESEDLPSIDDGICQSRMVQNRIMGSWLVTYKSFGCCFWKPFKKEKP